MYGTGIFLMVDNFNEISYSNFGKLFDTVFVFVSVVCLEALLECRTISVSKFSI
jgi:hypothetical protein